MNARQLLRLTVVAHFGLARIASAQTWRETAQRLGSARVLVIGARPEDEDNALIAWLSLGRNVETAYLSITRGESANNIVGTERQSALGVVRTAELLAERQRDGAHQYFTRAYDFGPTRSDSIVNAAWPHDSLLADVVMSQSPDLPAGRRHVAPGKVHDVDFRTPVGGMAEIERSWFDPSDDKCTAGVARLACRSDMVRRWISHVSRPAGGSTVGRVSGRKR